MRYTQKQKQLLLDNIFDGVVYFNIYGNIDIKHKNRNLSFYNPKANNFVLSWDNIWRFFENKNDDNYFEIKDLTQGILIDLTKQKKLITNYWRG